jgi:hypothetical protein
LQNIRSQLSLTAGVYGQYPGRHEGQDQRGGTAENKQSGPVAGTGHNLLLHRKVILTPIVSRTCVDLSTGMKNNEKI